VLYLQGIVTLLKEEREDSTPRRLTRGESGLTLHPPWQMMGALEAVDGMLLFGVSTAYVFAVMLAYWSMLAK
jgi:hypothetical protein